MSKGREQVRALEKELGVELDEIPFDELLQWYAKGIVLDDQGRLIGFACTNGNLKRIPKALETCINLKSLNLNRNHIQNIQSLKHLNQLNTLHLANNYIQHIQTLQNLNQLNTLNLSNNYIQHIHPLQYLNQLTTLDLTENQIQHIQHIQLLNRLDQLHLDRNKIQEIQVLQYLNQLKRLSLSSNHIQQIDYLLGLTNLEYLDLRNNLIRVLPSGFADFSLQTSISGQNPTIYLDDNPLVFPSHEILRVGINAIRAFYASAGEPEKLNEVKVVLVGEGGSGKTSLVKRIRGIDHNPHESTTHGIRIEPWSFPFQDSEFKVRLWDFGGQEIYHATHQFFLSERSIYVLVLDARRDDKTEYWLRHARNFGGDAPVLIVLNKADENPGFDINRNDLQKRYPQIKGFFKTSCATDEGIAAFIKALTQTIPTIDLHEIWWPPTWLAVKQAMEAANEPYLNKTNFGKLCKQQGVSDQEAAEVLVQLLHDLGVAIHFEELQLREFFILDPRWVTAAIYRMVRSPIVAKNGGVLNTDNALEACLNEPNPSVQDSDCDTFEFPSTLHNYLVELMEKFELCYRMNKREILLPNLLPKNEPQITFEDDNPLRYRIQYDFLPPTLMPSFMVQRHEEIDGDFRWRSGVVLQHHHSKARALVRSYAEDRQVLVHIYGGDKRGFLSSLRDTFAKIHSRFQRNMIRETIACPCSQCSKNEKPHFHDINAALGFVLKGIDGVPCPASFEMVPTRQILGEVQPNIDEQLKQVRDLLYEVQEKLRENDKTPIEKLFAGKIGKYGFTLNVGEFLKLLHKDPEPNPFVPGELEKMPEKRSMWSRFFGER